EILILIELQRNGVGSDDQLTDSGVRRSDLDREFAAQQDRGGDCRGGAGERTVFEPREATGQLEGKRHRTPPEDPNANRAANVDPCRSLAARRAWRTASARSEERRVGKECRLLCRSRW